jgi:hypothetical protein
LRPAPLLDDETKGDPQIMAEQMAHLLDLADRPNMTLLVIDYGHVSATPGPFTLLATAGPVPDLVADFSFNEPTYSQNPSTIADRIAAYEHLQSLAHEPEASRSIIAKSADRFAALTSMKGPV